MKDEAMGLTSATVKELGLRAGAGALDNPALFGQGRCYQVCYKQVRGQLELKCFQCRTVCAHRFGALDK